MPYDDRNTDGQNDDGFRNPWAILPPKVKAGILASVAWVGLTAFYVNQNHQVPSLIEYKADYSHFSLCGGNGAGTPGPDVQACLERSHAASLKDWKQDVGNSVVLPPLFGWLAAGGVFLVRWRLRERKAA